VDKEQQKQVATQEEQAAALKSSNEAMASLIAKTQQCFFSSECYLFGFHT
jgi:hypothetical protein